MARIYLVDDDLDLATLTRIALVQRGHEVMLFAGAQQAFEGMRKKKPDLILMDIMLPKLSGAEAVRQLRKDPDLKNIPVVFLTGLISYEEEDVEESGITIDGFNYKTLGKPYEIESLLKAVGNSIKL